MTDNEKPSPTLKQKKVLSTTEIGYIVSGIVALVAVTMVGLIFLSVIHNVTVQAVAKAKYHSSTVTYKVGK